MPEIEQGGGGIRGYEDGLVGREPLVRDGAGVGRERGEVSRMRGGVHDRPAGAAGGAERAQRASLEALAQRQAANGGGGSGRGRAGAGGREGGRRTGEG